MPTLQKAAKRTKVHRIVARVSNEDKVVIAQAAALAGQTVSSFVLSQAKKAAVKSFEEHNRIVLSATESRRFVAAILSPPQAPSARMKRAMRLHDKTVNSDV